MYSGALGHYKGPLDSALGATLVSQWLQAFAADGGRWLFQGTAVIVSKC